MKNLISIILLFVSFNLYGQIIITREEAKNILKEHEDYVISKVEIQKKDSIILIYKERVDSKDIIIEQYKAGQGEYEGIVADLRQEGYLLTKENKSLKRQTKGLKLIVKILVVAGVILAIL